MNESFSEKENKENVSLVRSLLFFHNGVLWGFYQSNVIKRQIYKPLNYYIQEKKTSKNEWKNLKVWNNSY